MYIYIYIYMQRERERCDIVLLYITYHYSLVLSLFLLCLLFILTIIIIISSIITSGRAAPGGTGPAAVPGRPPARYMSFYEGDQRGVPHIATTNYIPGTPTVRPSVHPSVCPSILYINMCMYVCMYVDIYVCVYIYIYILGRWKVLCIECYTRKYVRIRSRCQVQPLQQRDAH